MFTKNCVKRHPPLQRSAFNPKHLEEESWHLGKEQELCYFFCLGYLKFQSIWVFLEMWRHHIVTAVTLQDIPHTAKQMNLEMSM